MPYLIEAAAAIIAVILQVVASNFVSILGAVPDLALIFVVWTVIKRGQLVAELSGFALGLMLDIFSSGTLGSHSLSYTIVGFLLGYFFNDDLIEKRLRNWPFLLFVFFAAIINNVIFYLFFMQASGISVVDFAITRGGLGVVYTTIVAVLPMLFASRRPLY